MNFDIDDLTLEEIEQIEDLLNEPIDELFASKRKAKMMRALAWVFMRRENPEFTWEDAGKVKVDFLANVNAATSTKSD